MLEQLTKAFKILKHLNLADLLKLQALIKSTSFEKEEVIAQPGDRYPYFILIRKGVIRTYLLKTNGEEQTTRLAKEGDITSCAASVLTDSPSEEFLQATEATKALLVSVNAFKELAKDNLRFQKVVNDGLMETLHETIDRIRFFVMLSPEERYRKLLNESPDIIQRVPQKYLASYLGVTTVSLSRIRSRVAK